MGTIRPVTRLAGAAASAFVLLGAAALPAIAADPSASPGTGSGAGTGILDAGQSLNGVIALLAFGVVVLAFIFLYLVFSERQFFQALRRAARAGGGVDVTEVSAIASAEHTIRAIAGEELTTRVSLKVSGPGEVVIGQPAVYHAKDDSNADASDTVWTVDPDSRAAAIPSTGATVQVVAVKAGTFQLKASRAGGAAPVDLKVQAVKPAQPAGAAVKLPFVGAGWGSIVGAVTIATLAGALGLAKIIGGEAVATILGALAGYLFGTNLSGSGSGATSGTTAGGTTPPSDTTS